jgi:hypothetical protein
MISGIGPERAPNGDFGGRSFQGVGGAPNSLRGAPVPFPGAPNTPGSDIGEPNIMRDTAGRRSNATVQYSRVVPMGSKEQKLETEALQAGVLAWTSGDDRMQKRAGRGVERMYKLTSWNWLQSEVPLLPVDPDAGRAQGQPPRPQNHSSMRQKHALREGGATEAALELTANAAAYFGLDNPNRMATSPYLMWRDWDTDGYSLRDPESIDVSYDMLDKVRKLWHIIYETDDEDEGTFQEELQSGGFLPQGTVPSRLLSRAVMGKYTPDGFVLYKYSTEGTDSVAEGQLDDAQNGLFNIVVSGHAMVTSWAVFDPVALPYIEVQPTKKAKRLVTMPRDTLFIILKGKWVTEEASEGGGWFIDLRYVRSTSEELIRYSTRTKRLGPDTNVNLKEDEVVLGAASRTRPSTFNTAPVAPAQTMGLTVSVGIRWVTSYELHDMFHEREVNAEPSADLMNAFKERQRAGAEAEAEAEAEEAQVHSQREGLRASSARHDVSSAPPRGAAGGAARGAAAGHATFSFGE